MSLRSPVRLFNDGDDTIYVDKIELVNRLRSMSYRLHDINITNNDESKESLLPEIKKLIDQSCRIITSIPSDEVPQSHKRLNDYLFGTETLCDGASLLSEKREPTIFSNIYPTPEKPHDTAFQIPSTPLN